MPIRLRQIPTTYRVTTRHADTAQSAAHDPKPKSGALQPQTAQSVTAITGLLRGNILLLVDHSNLGGPDVQEETGDDVRETGKQEFDDRIGRRPVGRRPRRCG